MKDKRYYQIVLEVAESGLDKYLTQLAEAIDDIDPSATIELKRILWQLEGTKQFIKQELEDDQE